jgi:flagellar biosynthetic protein FliQ
MDVDLAVELSRDAVVLALKVGAPILVTAIFVGLVISVMQAVTQVQDQTISFVPKIVAMLLAGLFLLPWMVAQMVEYTTSLIADIPRNL